MADEDRPTPGNEAREEQVEQGIKGMRKAAQRLKEDMGRAPRKDRPRRYADSAIGDAEYVIDSHRADARDQFSRIETEEKETTADSLGDRLDAAESECDGIVQQARDTAETLWPTPMD